MRFPVGRSQPTEVSYTERNGAGIVSAMVYAVIPVFNRLALTKRCIELLCAQTYEHIEIIVSDGGSTDGTPKAIAEEFPRVTVLTSPRELWWAGAMAMGIDHVLKVSRGSTDFVLMMNNDTEFEEDYVSILVRTAQDTGGAVGALTVDSRDPTVILDGGEFIDWENYTFPVKTTIAPGEKFFSGVDVLPGRGSLVPVSMIRKAGNVNFRRFPHYISDYEFFARLKRHGFRLGVSYEAVLKSDPTVTGLAARPGEKRTLLKTIRLQLSRRSMSNVFDHYRFIDAAAPDELKRRVKRRFVRGLVIRMLQRLGVLPLARLIRRAYLALLWLVIPPYVVSAKDVAQAGVDLINGTRAGLLIPFAAKGGVRYFLRYGKGKAPALGNSFAALHDAARRSGQRVPRTQVLKWMGLAVSRAASPVYHIMEEQCRDLGLDPERLVLEGILRKDEVPGFYVLSYRNSNSNKQTLPEGAKALHAHARSHYYELRMERRLRMAEMSIKELH